MSGQTLLISWFDRGKLDPYGEGLSDQAEEEFNGNYPGVLLDELRELGLPIDRVEMLGRHLHDYDVESVFRGRGGMASGYTTLGRMEEGCEDFVDLGGALERAYERTWVVVEVETTVCPETEGS